MATKAELKLQAQHIKLKVRTGDKVVIIAGKDKGQIGFIAAVIQNYFLNYSWTFRDKQSSRTKARWLQASQFALVSIVGLGINALVREIVSYIFHPFWLAVFPNPMVAEVVNYNFSIIAAIGVVLFWNFAANRLWTFRNR